MRREKNQGGCIWSLMSKLHPRNSRSIQKLLLDNGRDGIVTVPSTSISHSRVMFGCLNDESFIGRPWNITE